MKQLCLAVLLLFLVTAGHGQLTGNITAAGTTCATTNACVSMILPANQEGTGTVGLVVSANAGGNTVQFEGTVDGTTWAAVSGFPLNSTTGASSTNTTGSWRIPVSGLKGLRARCSTFVTGTTTVTINPSPVALNLGGSGGSGGDTITSPNSTLGIGGTATNTTLDVLGAAGKILAGATPALTFTPTLGVDNTSAGTLTLANGSANAHTTFGSAATTSNTINGPAVVPADQSPLGCSTSGTTCTLIPLSTVTTSGPTTWTFNGTGNAYIGSGVVTLLASPATAKHVHIEWNLGQSTIGNCTTSGTYQLLLGYTDSITGFASTNGGGSPVKLGLITGQGAIGGTGTLAAGPGSASRDTLWTAISDLYVASGAAVTYRVFQVLGATGGTCDAFPVLTTQAVVTVY